MTETLGWGDVDVGESPRRRRRIRAAVIWVAVGAVVVGIGLWPTVKDTLADRAADWLQRQWHIAGGYESSRADIELAASLRLATGDEPIMVRIVQDLDREEADQLTKLAAAVDRHRLWAPSVESVGRTVHRALLAEAHDLRADVAAAPHAVPYATYGAPYSSNTETLVQRAGDQVQAMVHAHHLRLDTRKTAKLVSATGDVNRLQRVTDAPVNLRLAVLHDSQLDVWDLRTGRVRRNVITNLPVDPPNALTAVGSGSALLAQYDASWQLWPTSGPRAIPLPTDSPNGFYQRGGDDGLWRTDGGRIRRYDPAGHPVGPWYRYPSGMELDGFGATRDAIVNNLGPLDFNDPHPVLWYPRTGRIVAIDNPCASSAFVADRTIAFVSCTEDAVDVVDTSTGRTKTLRLPRGLSLHGSAPVISPDGSRLALLAGPRADDTDTPSLYVFDVRTSAVTRVQTNAAPINWSPDGSVLLLNMNGDGISPTTVNSSGLAPLAYWKPGMTDPVGIRLQLGNGTFSVIALP